MPRAGEHSLDGRPRQQEACVLCRSHSHTGLSLPGADSPSSARVARCDSLWWPLLLYPGTVHSRTVHFRKSKAMRVWGITVSAIDVEDRITQTWAESGGGPESHKQKSSVRTRFLPQKGRRSRRPRVAPIPRPVSCSRQRLPGARGPVEPGGLAAPSVAPGGWSCLLCPSLRVSHPRRDPLCI